MPGVTGLLILKDLVPQWFPRDGLYRKKSLIILTKGVRVVDSTDWLDN